MEFSGKSKCIVELGRERLSNPLGNYYIFISPSFKYPSGRDRPNLVKCTPQLAPCPCVIATRLAPCTCVSDTCSQGEPTRRAVRRKYGGSSPGGASTSAPWKVSLIRWRQPWPLPAPLRRKRAARGQAASPDREVDPRRLHLPSSKLQRTWMWNFQERVSA